jgi:hypothetical protein
MKPMLTSLAFFFLFLQSFAQTEERKIRVEGGLTVSMFQQQVKTEIGGARGERLVLESQFGLAASGTYRVLDFVSAGLFVRGDFGSREHARFDGFNAQGRAKVTNAIGGSYSEFWIGPLVQFFWRQLFVDFGYAVVGIRSDDGRTDLPSTTGDVTSALKTSASVAWLFGFGGNIELCANLDVVLKLDYRIRYYNQRGSNPLVGNAVHGTQSLAPFVGIALRL